MLIIEPSPQERGGKLLLDIWKNSDARGRFRENYDDFLAWVRATLSRAILERKECK